MVNLSKVSERVKNVSPKTIVYLSLILVILIVIICLFKYSIGKKVEKAQDRAKQASNAFNLKFISYFFG